jgi:hypothetical protein
MVKYQMSFILTISKIFLKKLKTVKLPSSANGEKVVKTNTITKQSDIITKNQVHFESQECRRRLFGDDK